MGLAFLIVPCLGWMFLGEPIRVPTLVGGALILAGIAITAHAS
jgi:drug/metabolite transporter (DMT)-like permease